MKVLDFLENRVANKTLSFTGTFLKALPSRIEKISFMIWFIACHWKILPIYFHLYSYFLFFLIYQCFQRNLPTDCSRSSKLIVSQTNALSHKSKGRGSPKHEAGFLLPSMEDCIRQNERQFYILNSKLSSSDSVEHIHTQNAQRVWTFFRRTCDFNKHSFRQSICRVSYEPAESSKVRASRHVF